MHFTITGSAHGWRIGEKFRLVDISRGRGFKAFIPHENWGDEDYTHPHELPEHLSTRLSFVPEGAVLVARCTACGGRYQRLVDLRDTKAGEDAFEALQQRMGLAAWGLDTSWVPVHRDCSTEPRRHHVPGLVQEFVLALESEARQNIGKRPGLLPMSCILDTSGSAYCFPVQDDLIKHQFFVREIIRQGKIDVLASISVVNARLLEMPGASATESAGEAPQQIPAFSDGLGIFCTTSTFGYYGVGCIRRMDGKTTGPGVVEPLGWTHIHEPLEFADTLLAGLRAIRSG